MRLTYPSMSSAVNDLKDMKTEMDEVQLSQEMNDRDLPIKLMSSHEYLRKFFTSSNVRVHKIIFLQIVTQKQPYYWGILILVVILTVINKQNFDLILVFYNSGYHKTFASNYQGHKRIIQKSLG